MDEQAEWWRMVTRLSPFLIPIASAIVALLIRDLLEPRQWQRYVRKTLASAFAGISVFAIIAAAYILLVQREGEDSLLAGNWYMGCWLRYSSGHGVCNLSSIHQSGTQPRLVPEQPLCLLFSKWIVANSLHASVLRMPSRRCDIHSWRYHCCERKHRRISSES